MKAYHISSAENKTKITKYGLNSATPRYEHAGNGIYVFFDKKYTNTMIEYIEMEDPILVEVEVPESDLLMDEDALLIDDNHNIEDLYEIMPPEAVAKYQKFLDENDGDAMPIDDPDTAQFKIELINQYQIKPHQKFKTEFGHYSIMTARCTNLPLKAIKVTTIK